MDRAGGRRYDKVTGAAPRHSKKICASADPNDPRMPRKPRLDSRRSARYRDRFKKPKGVYHWDHQQAARNDIQLRRAQRRATRFSYPNHARPAWTGGRCTTLVPGRFCRGSPSARRPTGVWISGTDRASARFNLDHHERSGATAWPKSRNRCLLSASSAIPLARQPRRHSRRRHRRIFLASDYDRIFADILRECLWCQVCCHNGQHHTHVPALYLLHSVFYL